MTKQERIDKAVSEIKRWGTASLVAMAKDNFRYGETDSEAARVILEKRGVIIDE